MNSISWRHHYIPQFYLKGFTSPNGMFKIYDVKRKLFIKNGKDFSPESYFFEKNGNSWISESHSDDSSEKSFAKIDSKIAEIFKRINQPDAENKFNVDDDDIALLQLFVGVMYWRNPANYNEIERIIDRKKLADIGFEIKSTTNKPIDIDSIEKRIKKDKNFAKMMKFWFPNISYPEIFNCNTPLHIMPFPEGFPSVCNDNPILVRDPDTFRVYNDDFIFPINNTKIFIRGKKLKRFTATVKIEIDMLMYKQAVKYVSCTDEKYLEHLDSLYENHYKSITVLRNRIFNQILE
ncbi:DUF4238 domain-containing protein [Marinifilum fragile]|uniref:DUF4238 domain-containing protein n=1 Tax=Marinifilum fragile TaxID=570161 RepID=UPI002AAACEF2|nr:DUF4238 domain-containing protein [Marinifilum fragile]